MRVCTGSMSGARWCRRSTSSRPVVDDPVAYGRIAGANALSDIYAMGGRPLTALAIAGFPKDADRRVLSQIFRGGLQALREAGVALLGGHTVQDQEIKFGYAITGEVDPARMWTNAGARAGRSPAADQGDWDGRDRDGHQVRPRGCGASPTQRSPRWCSSTEPPPRRSRRSPDGAIHACTDITGFGLIGHATEMARASGCLVATRGRARPAARGCTGSGRGNTPGGGRTNLRLFRQAARRAAVGFHRRAGSSCSTTRRRPAASWSRSLPEAVRARPEGAGAGGGRWPITIGGVEPMGPSVEWLP